MTAYLTLPEIEITSVGMEWQACTGPHTVTFENIADAIRAANEDPHVQVPRVKLGHFSSVNDGIPMWDPFTAVGDAEPVFGRVINLRATNDGATLVGTPVEVPEWLADAAPSAYPSRSAETVPDVVTPAGKRYSMVVTAVSFCGERMPAIRDLEDLQRLIESGPQAVQSASARAATAAVTQEGDIVPQAGSPTAASVSITTIRDRFNMDWAEDGQHEPVMDGESEVRTYWWWARDIRVEPNEVIADDDEGGLWAVPYSTDGENEVTFGAPVRVRETYVPVATAAAASSTTAPVTQRVLGVFSRPTKQQPQTTASSQGPDQERNPMDESVRRALATAHGLDPDTATEADVNAAVLTTANAPGSSAPEGTTPPVAPAPEAAAPESPAAPVAPAAPATPTATPPPASPAGQQVTTGPAAPPATPPPAVDEPRVTPPTTPPEGATSTTIDTPAGEPAPPASEAASEAAGELVGAAAAAPVGPSTVAVSQDVWKRTQDQLAALVAKDQAQEAASTRQRRDGKADEWVRTGRITPAERALARANLDINEAATVAAYDALAPGRIPVTQESSAAAASTATAEDSLYLASCARMGHSPTTRDVLKAA